MPQRPSEPASTLDPRNGHAPGSRPDSTRSPLTRPGPAGTRVARRALTLIEILIAVALLLALGAIIMPAMIRELDERQFEATADLVAEQLIMARAHAQTTGVAVEVVYDGPRERIVARPFHTDGAPPRTADSVSGLADDRVADWFLGDPDDPDATDVPVAAIPEPWAERVLPPGLRLTDRAPDTVEGVAVEDEGGFRILEIEAMIDGERPSIRIAVYLSNGSTLITRPVWFVDDDERAIELVVNAWTGLPVLTRLVPGAPSAGPDDEPDDEVTDDEMDEPDPADADVPPADEGNGAGNGRGTDPATGSGRRPAGGNR